MLLLRRRRQLAVLTMHTAASYMSVGCMTCSRPPVTQHTHKPDAGWTSPDIYSHKSSKAQRLRRDMLCAASGTLCSSPCDTTVPTKAASRPLNRPLPS